MLLEIAAWLHFKKHILYVHIKVWKKLARKLEMTLPCQNNLQ